MAKGRITYVPGSVFNEIKNIMDENNIQKPSIAFNEMVKFSQVGREASKIHRFMFGRK
jgi:hypothetical protein